MWFNESGFCQGGQVLRPNFATLVKRSHASKVSHLLVQELPRETSEHPVTIHPLTCTCKIYAVQSNGRIKYHIKLFMFLSTKKNKAINKIFRPVLKLHISINWLYSFKIYWSIWGVLHLGQVKLVNCSRILYHVADQTYIYGNYWFVPQHLWNQDQNHELALNRYAK